MTTAYDVPAFELIKFLTKELKKEEVINPPAWAPFVKTGTSKERPPSDPDWWYVRAAAVLRSVYLKGPVGVQRLRTKFGGRKNMGTKPEKFKKGSGSVIRKVVQQLENSGLVAQTKKGRKGRVITPKGRKLIDFCANKVK